MNILTKLRVWFFNRLNKQELKKVDGLVLLAFGDRSLPEVLSEQQEKNLLMQMADGSEQARDTLIEHNMRLVVYIASRFYGVGIENDDLISAGAIGLIKAVKSYSLEKNIKLATYASRCIENEILMQLRKVNRKKCEISLDEPLSGESESGDLVVADVLTVGEDETVKELNEKVDKNIINEILNGLEKRERDIIVFRFGLLGEEEKTQKEVADIMGISQSYISRIEKKILLKMRKSMKSIINE